MKVLVTGATGYIGQAVVQRLSSAGLEVLGVSRHSTPALDVASAESCRALLEAVSPDVVIHAAAESSPAKCEENDCLPVNAPRTFFEALSEKAPTARLIMLSTDQVYDGLSHMVSEHQVNPAPVNAYGRSKLACEGLVPDAVILRLSYVYGPPVVGAHATFLQFAEQKLRSPDQFDVFVDEVRNPIYIKDVVDAIAGIVSRPDFPGGVYHLGGPEALGRDVFVSIVAEHLGVSAEHMLRTERATCTAPWALKVRSPLDISMSSEKLETALGWKALSLRDALSDLDAELRAADL